MSQLYCGDCQNYLMGSDGQCHDCGCGWKQPVETYEKENTELEAEVARLQKENAELRERVKTLLGVIAKRYTDILELNKKLSATIAENTAQAKRIEELEDRLSSLPIPNTLAMQKISKLRSEGFEEYAATVLNKENQYCIVGDYGDVRWTAPEYQEPTKVE